MKLALITDPKGFPLIDSFDLGYHMALAQYVRSDPAYADFYRNKARKGHFIIMDNGAAEEGVLKLHEILTAAQDISADEIVLPDVLANAQETIAATMDPFVLEAIPPKQRAVVPQGDTMSEWLDCANYFMENLDFATLCVPKHTERFKGGRVAILNMINKLGWNQTRHVHMLGVWDNAFTEVKKIRDHAPWVRGIDTAVPFAMAQHDMELTASEVVHVSHAWGRKFNRNLAYKNIATLLMVSGFS